MSHLPRSLNVPCPAYSPDVPRWPLRRETKVRTLTGGSFDLFCAPDNGVERGWIDALPVEIADFAHLVASGWTVRELLPSYPRRRQDTYRASIRRAAGYSLLCGALAGLCD